MPVKSSKDKRANSTQQCWIALSKKKRNVCPWSSCHCKTLIICKEMPAEDLRQCGLSNQTPCLAQRLSKVRLLIRVTEDFPNVFFIISSIPPAVCGWLMHVSRVCSYQFDWPLGGDSQCGRRHLRQMVFIDSVGLYCQEAPSTWRRADRSTWNFLRLHQGHFIFPCLFLLAFMWIYLWKLRISTR